MRASPCRSSDGILYTGKLIYWNNIHFYDQWLVIIHSNVVISWHIISTCKSLAFSFYCLYLAVWNFLFVHSALHLLLLIISCVVKKIIFNIGRKTDVWYAIDLDTGIKQQTLKLDGTETVCPMMSNKRAPVFLGRTGTLIDLHFISPSYICLIFLQIKKMIYFKMVS